MRAEAQSGCDRGRYIQDNQIIALCYFRKRGACIGNLDGDLAFLKLMLRRKLAKPNLGHSRIQLDDMDAIAQAEQVSSR